MATRPAGELDIESLISAPLVAAAKANAAMSAAQTDFLLRTCFTEQDGGTVHPVTVEMTVSGSAVTGVDDRSGKIIVNESLLTFKVPLLSLMPISSLGVSDVEVHFDMEVTTMTGSGQQKAGAVLRGKVAHNQGGTGHSEDTSRTSRNLKVNIKASPLPLPRGVITLIDMYTKAIRPTQAGHNDTDITD